MREIKFRAWDKEEKKMTYDAQNAYDFGCGGCYISTESFKEVLEDDNFEVMQYIGVADKKDKEIYEGDVCLVSCGYFNIKDDKSKVIFKDGCFCFQFGCTDDYVKIFNAWDTNSIEVIGNIYENPELLEVE